MPRVKSQKKKGKNFHMCFHSLWSVLLYVFPVGWHYKNLLSILLCQAGLNTIITLYP